MENSENEGVKPVVALVKFSAGPVVPLDMDPVIPSITICGIAAYAGVLSCISLQAVNFNGGQSYLSANSCRIKQFV